MLIVFVHIANLLFKTIRRINEINRTFCAQNTDRLNYCYIINMAMYIYIYVCIYILFLHEEVFSLIECTIVLIYVFGYIIL